MATADSTDDAVGRLTAPAWARAVPGSAWFVLALAGLVVWLRASWEIPAMFAVEPVGLFWLGVRTFTSAVGVGLLAVALAGRTVGSVRRALVAGTACLALAELATVVADAGERDRALLQPRVVPDEPLPADAPFALGITVLRLVGPPLIALALVRAAGSEPADRAARTGERSSLPGVLIVAGLILSLARLAMTIIGVLSTDPESPFTLSELDLAGSVVSCFGPLAWSTVAAAAVASRRPAARDWLCLVLGSLVIFAADVLGSVIAVVLVVAGSVDVFSSDDGSVLFRLIQVGSVLNLLGLVGLMAGLATGPTSAAGRPVAADEDDPADRLDAPGGRH